MPTIKDILPRVRMSSHDYVGLTPKDKEDIRASYKYLVKHKDKQVLFHAYQETLKILSHKGTWAASRKIQAINKLKVAIIHKED